MVATGEKFPTTAATASEAPWSDNDWNTPGNVTADDGSTANCIAASFDSPDQTFVLKAQGFDFSSIPDGSTIDGVTARVNAWFRSGQGSGSLDLCQLLDTSSAKVGTNQCATPVALTTTTTTIITKGGVADPWGNALDAAWVKSANFGIALGVLATAANADVDIDYVTLDIEYTPPSGPIEVAVNPALETDTALAVGKVDPIFAAVTMATETDSALALGRLKAKLVGQATETDSAEVVTPAMGGGGPFFIPIVTATETDTAESVGKVDPILRVLATASETDTAQAVGLLDPIFRAIVVATETDTALALTGGVAGSETGTLGDRILAALRVIYPGTESMTELLQRYRQDNGITGWDAYVQHVAPGSPTDNLMDDQWGFFA